jgi:alkylhydroperoxidase/carboxymuconolactone decarboxylase family protein YurZ
MEKTEMTTSKTTVDTMTEMLISAAAAVAVGDMDILREFAAKAVAEGASPEDLMKVTAVGNMVRARPAAHMLEVADVLTGSNYVTDTEHVCPASQLDTATDDYFELMLISAGAAMAANCEPCLNQVVPNLIEAGASFELVREAVAIGKKVKDRVLEKSIRTSLASIQNLQALAA